MLKKAVSKFSKTIPSCNVPKDLDLTVETNNLIKNNDCYIAGGSILSVIRKTEINDIDVYTRVENKDIFYGHFYKLGYRVAVCYSSSNYTASFFKRNGIHGRVAMSKEGCKDIDLIFTVIDPLVCISRFDLTCCQVWYDGHKIGGTHLELTRCDKSYINPEYQKIDSHFLKKRIEKYQSKGIEIMNMPVEDKHYGLELCPPKPCVPASIDILIKKKLFDTLCCYNRHICPIFMENNSVSEEDFMKYCLDIDFRSYEKKMPVNILWYIYSKGIVKFTAISFLKVLCSHRSAHDKTFDSYRTFTRTDIDIVQKINLNPMVIQFMENIPDDLCHKAMSLSRCVFRYTSMEFRTFENYLKYFSRSQMTGVSVQFITDLTKEKCETLILQGVPVRIFPMKFLSDETMLKHLTIYKLPRRLITEEMAEKEFKKTFRSIIYSYHHVFWTKKMRDTRTLIRNTSQKLRWPDIGKLFSQSITDIFFDKLDEINTEDDMFKFLFEHNIVSLKSVKNITSEIVEYAIKGSIVNLNYAIDRNLLTREQLKEAFEKYPSLFPTSRLDSYI